MIISSVKHIFIKIRTIKITFLPTKNKFIYSYYIKFHAVGFSDILESIFCLLLVVEVFSLQEIIDILEELIVSGQRSGECSKMRQNFLAQIIQLLKCWCVICGWAWLTVVTEKNWSLSAIFHGFSSVSWAYFSDVICSQDLETCSGSDEQQTTSNCELFLVQFWL